MKKKFIPLNKKTQKVKGKDNTIIEKVIFGLSPKTKKAIHKDKLSEIQSRIKSTYIPKHLNNIQIAESPKNRVQIIGQDDKGRQQYFYAKEYADKSENRKYKNLKNLSLIIHKLETENTRKIISIYKKLKSNPKYKPTKQEMIELINYFLIYHHIRIGSKQYLDKYGSTGISTLKKQHFKFIKDKSGNEYCIVSFKGKKGVINNCRIEYRGNDNMNYNANNNGVGNNNDGLGNNDDVDNNDRIDNNTLSQQQKKDIHYFIIKVIKALNEQKTKKEFTLDYTYKNPITNSYGHSIIDTTDYKNYFLDKYRIEITPKMFRTWFANYYLVNYLVLNNQNILTDIKQCKTKGQRKAYVSKLKADIIEQISSNLNNTPAICKKKYINNKFLGDVVNRVEYYCKKCALLRSNNHIKQRRNIHTFLINQIF
jgi:DNA topoisomerase IB